MKFLLRYLSIFLGFTILLNSCQVSATKLVSLHARTRPNDHFFRRPEYLDNLPQRINDNQPRKKLLGQRNNLNNPNRYNPAIPLEQPRHINLAYENPNYENPNYENPNYEPDSENPATAEIQAKSVNASVYEKSSSFSKAPEVQKLNETAAVASQGPPGPPGPPGPKGDSGETCCLHTGPEETLDAMFTPINLNHILFRTGCLLSYEGKEPTSISVIHNNKVMPSTGYFSRVCIMCIKNAPYGVTPDKQRCGALMCLENDNSESNCNLHDIYSEGYIIPTFKSSYIKY